MALDIASLTKSMLGLAKTLEPTGVQTVTFHADSLDAGTVIADVRVTPTEARRTTAGAPLYEDLMIIPLDLFPTDTVDHTTGMFVMADGAERTINLAVKTAGAWKFFLERA